MKYLKVFETDTDQQNYINGEFDRPNITIVRHKKQSINYVPNIPEVPEPAIFYLEPVDYNISYLEDVPGVPYFDMCTGYITDSSIESFLTYANEHKNSYGWFEYGYEPNDEIIVYLGEEKIDSLLTSMNFNNNTMNISGKIRNSEYPLEISNYNGRFSFTIGY